MARKHVGTIVAITLAWLAPSNAFRPITISLTTAPKAKISLRTSASAFELLRRPVL